MLKGRAKKKIRKLCPQGTYILLRETRQRTQSKIKGTIYQIVISDKEKNKTGKQ